jgi:hypothetical protein
MNALCNSQMDELERFLCFGYAKDAEPVSFARYTGQETTDERLALAANPPDMERGRSCLAVATFRRFDCFEFTLLL